ncbi:Interferon-induced protein with tetratricopeptide repeats 5 [Holothuria leucospilota]|uniref:Interferon-induced protein with tetratricopeptide repeats 5 n=1 Tax=Holothuria leucospilota TaxID=206669 RepID=A0A9Q0YE08_HOLLE|nr:Interferon-induced protein with tetratricopeptide repeats 5 [Holothuria leucospilota]
MSLSEWWKDLPCPLHPSWGLDDISELDLRQLKHNVDTDENECMVVETAVYRAFLEFPCGRFYNQGRANSTEALRYLEVAKDHISGNFRGNIDAEIGYGIIIHTFHMWIIVEASTESILRDLIAKKDKHPSHASYMEVTQAYFFSRLGPRWGNKALSLYESALQNFPDNCQWLFGKALMLGREARRTGFVKGWTHRHIRETFRKEKNVLQRILELNPNFYLARAFYGQVLHNLGEDGAELEISLALNRDPRSRTIAMIAVRFYRRNRQFIKAEKILKDLLDTYNTAEIHFQLGYLYSFQARLVGTSERPNLWKVALSHFNSGAELNVCHFACYTKRAEMHALLGETHRAKHLFKELFEHIYKDSPHLLKNEMLSIDTALEMRLPEHLHVFTTNEVIKYSHRYITLATEDDRTEINNDKGSIPEKVKNRLGMLRKISCNNIPEKDVRRLARLKLADCYRRLQSFKDAEQLYSALLQENETAGDKAEIIWGLGKCYHSQGYEYYDRAIIMAMKLERMDQTEFSANELYADACLCRARAELTNFTDVGSDRIPQISDVLECLENAIDMGSLEACYLLLSNVNDLHKHYFNSQLRFPEILAKIRATCENASLRKVHTDFRLKLDDGSEVVYDEQAKRDHILLRVNKHVKYDILISNDTHRVEEIRSEYKQLEALRRTRLDFEYELLGRKEGENWNTSCKEKLIEVLRIARETLDHLIHVYQMLVLEKSPGRSLFTIHFDWKKANVDKDSTENKLKQWIKASFPGYTMPDRIIQTILKVQPMYDKDNLWLAALGSFNSAVKHKGNVGEETFDLELKEAEWIRLKSEDIVRRSCQEVERLALYFLTEFTTLKNETLSDQKQSKAKSSKGKQTSKGAEWEEFFCGYVEELTQDLRKAKRTWVRNINTGLLGCL